MAKSQQKPDPNTRLLLRFLKKRRKFIILVGILGFSLLAIQFGIDKQLVALIAVLIGLLTQAFAVVLGLIALVPFVGPLIVKVLLIPIFWIINAISNFIATIAVKQGFGRDIANSKLVVIVLLVGMILGYMLGHWFPV